MNTKWLLSLLILVGGSIYAAHVRDNLDDSDEAQSMGMMQGNRPMMMQDKSMPMEDTQSMNMMQRKPMMQSKSMGMKQGKSMMMQGESMMMQGESMMKQGKSMMMQGKSMMMPMDKDQSMPIMSDESSSAPAEDVQSMDVGEPGAVLSDEDRNREEWGPWPIDVPLRAIPAPYCGQCKRQSDGTYRRSWGVWPLDVPLRVLPTRYCGRCDND